MQFRPNTLVRRVDLPGSRVRDEMIFFNPEIGEYSAIGEVGIEIWEFLGDSERSVTEICDHLVLSFEVDRETCEKDVSEFLEQLEKAGLLDKVTA